MKKVTTITLLAVLISFSSFKSKAQSVGINNDGSLPDSSALLDVKSLHKGMLIPRTKTNAIVLPAKGLLIYDTTTNTFWYHNGIAWNEIGKQGWNLSGNSGTIDGTHFLGTTDNIAFNIRVNNEKSGRIDPNLPYTTSFGYKSLYSITSGTANTAFGAQSLYSNTTGFYNTATGYQALLLNKGGNSNSAFGYQALLNDTSGVANTAVGASALFANSLGTGNTASGYSSLYANTTGFYNTAVGMNTLISNTGGSRNTASGAYALISNKTGNDNVAVGFQSLLSNNSGTQNTAVGNYALNFDTSGSNNTAIGFQALYYNSNAIDNVAVGYQSMNANKTASWNTAIGAWSLPNDSLGISNTSMGYQSLYYNGSGSENCAYGRDALMNNQSGYQNTGIGTQTLVASNGNGNTAVGYNSGRLNINGNYNTAIGDSATVLSIALTNTTAIGAKSSVSTNNTMAFGDIQVNRWAFARDNVATGILQVGYNNTNGNGAYLTPGGVWTDISDINLKEEITPQNTNSILQKIMQLPVTKWKYKGTSEYHIGPMAQDFKELFGIGDGKSLSAMDKTGVTLLGIQALKEENESLKKTVDELLQRIERLEKKLLQ